MAENQLKIQLGADVAKLSGDIAAATNILKSFGKTTASVFDGAARSFNSFSQSGNLIAKTFDVLGTGKADLENLNRSIDAAADKAAVSAGSFTQFGDKVLQSISKIGTAAGGILSVTAAINEAAIAARNAGENFLAIGVKTPVQDIQTLRNNVNQLKQDLAAGFKPIVDLVDPKTPALLNSVSAALTNISPAVNAATASLTASIAQFNLFETEAQQLSSTFSKIPTSLKPIDVSTLGALREAVRSAKTELATFKFQAPLNEINGLKTSVAELRRNLEQGFKPIVGIIDPATPDLVKRVTVSLATIPPIVDNTSNSLRKAGDASKAFAGTINVSLFSAIKNFDLFKTEALQLGSAFDKIPSSLKPFNTSGIDALRGSVNRLKVDMNGLRLQSATTQFNNVNKAAQATANSLKNTQATSKAANFAFTDLGRVIQDLPFGFQGIQNNITQLPGSFKALSLAAKESGQTMSKVLLSSLIGSGGIGLAISAVTAAVTFASVGFGSWSKILGISGKAAKQAKSDTDEYAESLKSIVSSLAQEATRVSLLVNALKNETLSRKERTAALEELKRVNPEYFAGLKDEKGLIDDLSIAYKGYINSLKKKFEVKVLEQQLDKLFNRKFELEVSLDPKAAIAKNKELTDEIFKRQALLKKRIAALGGEDILKGLTSEDIFRDRITDAQREVIELVKTLKSVGDVPLIDFGGQGAKQLQDVNGQIDILLEKVTSLGKIDLDLGGGNKSGTKKEDAQLKDLKNTLEGYRKELAVVNELKKEGILPKFRVDDLLELEENIIKTLNAIDAREVEIKLKPKLEIDKTLTELELNKITKEFGVNIGSDVDFPVEVNPLIQKQDFFTRLKQGFDRKEITQAIVEAVSGITVSLPFTIDPIVSNVKQTVDKFKKGLAAVDFSEAFQPMIDNLKAAAAEASIQMNAELKNVSIDTEGIKDILANAFGEMGSGIGEAIAKGQNPFIAAAKGFLGVIGAVVEQFGKKVIALGTSMLAVKKGINLSFNNPAIAIAAGIALTALGAALRNIQFNVPKLAQGGITSGPTLAMIGESGREAVIPLNKMDSVLSGGAVTETRHIIKGSELHLITTTYQRERGRGL
jgi:hypothetical protein